MLPDLRLGPAGDVTPAAQLGHANESAPQLELSTLDASQVRVDLFRGYDDV